MIQVWEEDIANLPNSTQSTMSSTSGEQNNTKINMAEQWVNSPEQHNQPNRKCPGKTYFVLRITLN